MPDYRAWRFLHPDLEGEGDPTGLTISPRGRIQMIEDDGAIRQAIILLLSTSPGERAGRPDYGCPLHLLVFSPNDDTTAGLAIHYVRQAIGRWEPRVEVIHLDAGRNPESPETLDIYLRYRARTTRRIAEVATSLNLAGEAA